MKRAAEFSDEWGITIQLAYYPPYPRPYNPVELVWGVLENYWKGYLLDTVALVEQFAKNMTYNGVHPVVKVIRDTYDKGVKLTKKAMAELEKRFERKLGLEKWFVRIVPVSLE